MFSSSTYTNRRNQLLSPLSSGLILLLGNEESGMNYAANTYPFRQDSTFLYYFGIDQPGLAATLDIESGEVIVFGNELTLDDIVWTGPQPSLVDKCARIGVSKSAPASAFVTHVQEARQQGRTLHFLPPYRPENIIQLAELLAVSPKEVKAKASVALIKAVVAQRSIKTAEEVVELDKAVRITNQMHLTAMRAARPGMTEAALTAAVYHQAMETAAHHPSFPIILSVNGQVLHNHHHDNTLQSGQMVLCDAGGESKMHYAGDMTRTFPVDAAFTTRQREVYQIVLDSMNTAIDALTPGILYRDVHLKTATVITNGLKALGLMKGNTEEAVAAGAHALFFPHGLGHMMGLDVHDMEDLGEAYVGYTDTLKKSTQFGLAFLRLGRALEPGFAITVEPGIYFIPELIDMWKAEGKHSDFINYETASAYKDFGGIRIEDDYLITETGSRLLGDQVPKSVEAVEEVRREMLG